MSNCEGTQVGYPHFPTPRCSNYGSLWASSWIPSSPMLWLPSISKPSKNRSQASVSISEFAQRIPNGSHFGFVESTFWLRVTCFHGGCLMRPRTLREFVVVRGIHDTLHTLTYLGLWQHLPNGSWMAKIRITPNSLLLSDWKRGGEIDKLSK